VDGRDSGSKYSELANFPKFPPFLCVGNFGKIGVWCSGISVFGVTYGFEGEKCQPGLVYMRGFGRFGGREGFNGSISSVSGAADESPDGA